MYRAGLRCAAGSHSGDGSLNLAVHPDVCGRYEGLVADALRWIIRMRNIRDRIV